MRPPSHIRHEASAKIRTFRDMLPPVCSVLSNFPILLADYMKTLFQPTKLFTGWHLGRKYYVARCFSSLLNRHSCPNHVSDWRNPLLREGGVACAIKKIALFLSWRRRGGCLRP